MNTNEFYSFILSQQLKPCKTNTTLADKYILETKNGYVFITRKVKVKNEKKIEVYIVEPEIASVLFDLSDGIKYLDYTLNYFILQDTIDLDMETEKVSLEKGDIVVVVEDRLLIFQKEYRKWFFKMFLKA